MSHPSPESRSRVPDLSFRVFDRVLHPDWFSVKSHRRVARQGWVADVRIIDRGHLVTWSSGQTRLTELLLSSAATFPPTGLLYETRVLNEKTTSLRPSAEVEYQSVMEMERTDPDVFAHLSQEFSLDANRSGLAFEFPAVHRMASGSIIQIALEVSLKGLLIHTFHTFPVERVVVRTQSLFETRLAIPAT